MDLELTGRVALVTAASKGLGRATATRLAAEGAQVMISSRGEEQLARTAAEIAEATGARVEHCAADVSDAADVTRLLLNKTPGDRVVPFSAPGVEIEGELPTGPTRIPAEA